MNNELARRAVACRHWRWMPGMLWLLIDEDGVCYNCDRVTQANLVFSDALPDLTDPCTLGALLGLVREAWGDPTLHVWCSRQLGLWVVSASGQEIGVEETTEAEALVAALEAAP